MKPVSLADITYEQGLQLLVLRKQAMDQGQIRRMTPEALANTLVLRDIGHSFAEKSAEGSWLENLKSGIGQLGQKAQQGLGQVQSHFANLDPASRNTLLAGLAGTGLGAAAGLGHAAMNGDDNYLTSAIRGGVAGGAMGGGLGLALNPQVAEKLYGQGKSLINSFKKKEPSAPAAGTDAETPPAAAGGAAAPSGITPEDPERARSLSAAATSSAPEITAGGLGAATLAGTGYGLHRTLRPRSYDPRLLATELVGNAGKDLLDPSTAATARRLGYSQLLSANASDPRVAEKLHHMTQLRNANQGQMVDAVENILKQQGHSPTWLGRFLGTGMSSSTAEQAGRALGKTPEELNQLLTRPGIRNAAGKIRWGRALIPSLIAATGTAALGGIGSNYLQNIGERNQALEDYLDIVRKANSGQ